MNPESLNSIYSASGSYQHSPCDILTSITICMSEMLILVSPMYFSYLHTGFFGIGCQAMGERFLLAATLYEHFNHKSALWKCHCFLSVFGLKAAKTSGHFWRSWTIFPSLPLILYSLLSRKPSLQVGWSRTPQNMLWTFPSLKFCSFLCHSYNWFFSFSQIKSFSSFFLSSVFLAAISLWTFKPTVNISHVNIHIWYHGFAVYC